MEQAAREAAAQQAIVEPNGSAQARGLMTRQDAPAVWAAAILRWPVPLAPEAQWSLATRITRNNLLDENLVLPVVAEVVDI